MQQARLFPKLLILLMIFSFALCSGEAQSGGISKDPLRQVSSNQARYEALDFERIPTQEERQMLEAYGIKIIDFIGHSNGRVTYWCYLSDKAAEKLTRRKDHAGAITSISLKTRGGKRVTVAPYAMDWRQKLSAALDRGEIPAHAAAGDGSAMLYVLTMPNPDVQAIRDDLARFGVVNPTIVPPIKLVYFPLHLDDLARLASLPWVRKVDFSPAPEELENENSAAMIRVRALNSAHNAGLGLTGQGVSVGIFDSQTKPHVDFGGRLHTMERGQKNPHGEHVAGTIGGSGKLDPRARGMAPAAELYAWNFDNVDKKYIEAFERYNATVLHNSWGAPLRCDDWDEQLQYNLTNELKDAVAIAQPYANLVFSAGNSGAECDLKKNGFFTTTRTAKNIITVGAVDVREKIADFSSRGPLGDGRLSPLVCAFGVDVYSTVWNNGYEKISGTSMSGPAISGLLTLLTEQYRAENAGANPPAILLKNAVLNTAIDKGNKGPDYVYGYGLANGEAASKLLSEKRYALGEIMANEQQNVKTISVPRGVKQLRVMIVWHDQPGSGAQSDLINDLDLSVRGNGQVYLPFVLNPKDPAVPATKGHDRLNNHEQVVIEHPAEGNYECIVDAFRILSNRVAYSISYEFDFEDDIRIAYPLGGEVLNALERTNVRWETESSAPLSIFVSYDGGENFELLLKDLDPSIGRALVRFDKSRWSSQVKLRLVQADRFVENTVPFTVTATPQVESVVAYCSEFPKIAWSKLGDDFSYTIATLDAAAVKYTVLFENITDTTHILMGYDYSLPIVVKGKKGGIEGAWSSPIQPAGMRPIKIDPDKVFYSRQMERLNDPDGILKLSIWNRLITKEGVLHVGAWLDGETDWKDPGSDYAKVFDLNPTYVATYYHCLDLTALSDKELHVFMQTPPRTQRAFMRLRVLDENGENPVILDNTWGSGVQTASKPHLDFNISAYQGKKVVVATDMAVCGPAILMGNRFVDVVALGGFSIHTPPLRDIQMNKLIVAESSQELTAEEQVSVELLNFGANEIADENLKISIFDGEVKLFDEIVNVNLRTKEKKVYTLRTRIDLSREKCFYQLRAVVEMQDDAIEKNNVVKTPRSNLKGYLLIPTSMYYQPKPKVVPVGEKAITFTDNMGAYENAIIKDYNPLLKRYVPLNGYLDISPEQVSKYVSCTVNELDLGENELQVYYVNKSTFGENYFAASDPFYTFTGKIEEPVTLTTQKPGQRLRFMFVVNDINTPVPGWVAELKQVAAPETAITNDIFVANGISFAPGSEPNKVKVTLTFSSKQDQEYKDVLVGYFVDDKARGKGYIPSIAPRAYKQNYLFEKEFTCGPHPSIYSFQAMIFGGDPVETNNIAKATYVHDVYQPTRVSLEYIYKSTMQISQVSCGSIVYSTPVMVDYREQVDYPYFNRSNTVEVNLDAPKPIEVILEKPGAPSFSGRVGLWVDINQNQTFDADELVGVKEVQLDGMKGKVAFDVASLPNIVEGEKYVMRFVAVEGAVDPVIGENSAKGQIQDYSLSFYRKTPIATDLAILSAGVTSDDGKSVEVVLKNYGVSAVVNPEILISVDDEPAATFPQAVTIATGESLPITLSLSSTKLDVPGVHKLKISHQYANDENSANNELLITWANRKVQPQPGVSYMLSFSGDQGVAAVSDFNELESKQLTYEGWVKVDDYSFVYGRFFDSPVVSCFFTGYNNNVYKKDEAIVVSLNETTIYHTDAGVAPRGQWIHVALTLDRSDPKTVTPTLYVNGVLTSLQVLEGQAVPEERKAIKAGPFLIGNSPARNRGFCGAIDEFRIWNVLRTPQQIEEYMQKHLPSDATGIIAEFQFNEGIGAVESKSSIGDAVIDLSALDCDDPQSGCWRPEPMLELLTAGIEDASEKLKGDVLHVELPEGADIRAVALQPKASHRNATIMHDGASLPATVDLSSDYGVDLSADWFGKAYSKQYTVHAFTKVAAEPSLLTLSLGAPINSTVEVKGSMEIATAGGVDLSAVPITFTLAPADAILQVNGVAVTSGASVDLTKPVMLVVKRVVGAKDKTYVLSVKQSYTTTWSQDPISLTYGDDAPLLDAQCAGAEVRYESDDPSVIKFIGKSAIVVGAGSTKIRAIPFVNDMPMGGAVERDVVIAKKDLQVSTPDLEIDFSDPVPTEFDILYDGFVGLDNVKKLDVLPTASTTAKLDDEPGAYPITLAGGEDRNYQYQFHNGNLTIRGATAVEIYNVTFVLTDESTGNPMKDLKFTVAGRERTTSVDGKASVKLKKGNYPFIFDGGTQYESIERTIAFDKEKEESIVIQPRVERFTLTFKTDGFGLFDDEAEKEVIVRKGDNSPTIVATAKRGYEFDRWEVSPAIPGLTLPSEPKITIENVQQAATFTAYFKKSIYTLKYIAGEGGTIQGEKEQRVEYLSAGSEVVAVPNAGYTFTKWSDGLTKEKRTDIATDNLTVTAMFTKPYALPFTEDFETSSTSLADWQNGGKDAKQWIFTNVLRHSYALKSGRGAGFNQGENGSSRTKSDVWIISPMLSVENKSAVTIEFDYVSRPNQNSFSPNPADNFIVSYSTDQGVTWQKLHDFGDDVSSPVKFSKTLDENMLAGAKTLQFKWHLNAAGFGLLLFDNVKVTGEELHSEYTLSYAVPDGEELWIDDALHSETSYSVTLPKNSTGPKVEAKSKSGLAFRYWSDGELSNPRVDKAVRTIDVKAVFAKDCDKAIVVNEQNEFLEDFEEFDMDLECWEFTTTSNGEKFVLANALSRISFFTGKHLQLNTEGLPYQVSSTASFVTPKFDLSQFNEKPILEFSIYHIVSGETVKIYYSVDGGAIWKEFTDYVKPVYAKIGNIILQIPEVSDNMKFRFEVSNFTKFIEFSIDNFRIASKPYFNVYFASSNELAVTANANQTIRSGGKTQPVSYDLQDDFTFLGWYDSDFDKFVENLDGVFEPIEQDYSFEPVISNVYITVHDEADAPIQDVKVSLSDGVNPPIEAKTNAKGVASFLVPSATYSVSTDHSFYLPAENEQIVVEDDVFVRKTIKLKSAPTFLVEFTVQGEDGAKLAAVSFVCDGLLPQKTDQNGGLSYQLPKGSYTFQLSLDGYMGQEVKVEVDDAPVSESVTLKKVAPPLFDLVLIVQNADGTRISNAVISYPGGQEQTTSTNGIVIYHLDAGTYAFTIAAPGYETVTEEVVIENEGVERTITLTPFSLMFSKLTLIIIDVDGNPLPSAQVVLPKGQIVDADSEGKVVVSLIEGQHALLVKALGYQDQYCMVNMTNEDSEVTVKMSKLDILHTPVPADVLASLKVRPNPVVDILYIDNVENVEILELYSAAGVLVRTVQLSGEPTAHIDMQGLTPGLYLLQARIGVERRIAKIIKQSKQ